ncbi:MAG: helix-turn-helix transcriptional regulator [Novosphingobium sp.]
MRRRQTLPTSPDGKPTMLVEAELAKAGLIARIVRYDIPNPTVTLFRDLAFQINMCLTPRPLDARGCYHRRWGPHRFERLGDVFVVPPGEELLIKGGSIRQASLLCEVPPRTVIALVGDLAWNDRQLSATLDLPSATVRALLNRLAGEVRHPGFASDQMLKMLGGELAIELARFCLELHGRPATGGLAAWRLRLIDARLAAQPAAALADLAGLCGLSVRQLTRGFKVSRGCSIGDYIEQRRMEAAKRLLLAGESVKSVAFATGYASPSSFTYAFRRGLGMSPTRFRSGSARHVQAD